jgi:hypothetical protein
VSFRIAWRRILFVASLALLMFAVRDSTAQPGPAAKSDDEQSAPTADDAPEGNTLDNDANEQRAERLKAVKERVSQITVRIADEESEAELIAMPLLCYVDQPRLKFDATLWGWIADGRLLAICKIEYVDRDAFWSTCFVSLAQRQIDADWARGRRWSARKPGIELKSLVKAPPAVGDRNSRLREMKRIAARFTGTIIKGGDNREEMRILPRPVFRYDMPTGNVLDGAVFALTSNGTNPGAILVLELHGDKGGIQEWKFGVTGMTSGELSVRLDDQEVWGKHFINAPGSFETWFWFKDRE